MEQSDICCVLKITFSSKSMSKNRLERNKNRSYSSTYNASEDVGRLCYAFQQGKCLKGAACRYFTKIFFYIIRVLQTHIYIYIYIYIYMIFI
jgi:hypothetical protein